MDPFSQPNSSQAVTHFDLTQSPPTKYNNVTFHIAQFPQANKQINQDRDKRRILVINLKPSLINVNNLKL